MTNKTSSIFLGLIDLVLVVVESLLCLRFVLRLFSANPEAPITRWIWSLTNPLLWPFRGLLTTSPFGRGWEFALTIIFAMLVYALVGYLLTSLIAWTGYLTRPDSNTTSQQHPETIPKATR